MGSYHAKKSQIFREIQAFSKKKKKKRKRKVFKLHNFSRGPGVLQDEKNGQDLIPFSTNQKLVLSSAEAFSRTCKLRSQGLDLRGQGQALQTASLRTPPLLLRSFLWSNVPVDFYEFLSAEFH